MTFTYHEPVEVSVSTLEWTQLPNFVPRYCVACRALIGPSAELALQAKRKYCSTSCRNAARRARRRGQAPDRFWGLRHAQAPPQ